MKKSHLSVRVSVCLNLGLCFHSFCFHERAVPATNVFSWCLLWDQELAQGGFTTRPTKMKLQGRSLYVHTIGCFCKICKSKIPVIGEHHCLFPLWFPPCHTSPPVRRHGVALGFPGIGQRDAFAWPILLSFQSLKLLLLMLGEQGFW